MTARLSAAVVTHVVCSGIRKGKNAVADAVRGMDPSRTKTMHDRSPAARTSRAFLVPLTTAIVLTALATRAPAQEPEAGRLDGRVTSRRSDAPIAGATVRIVRMAVSLFERPTYRREILAETMTDDSGRFAFARVPPGDLYLESFAQGFGTAARSWESHQDGEPKRIDLALDDGDRLRGRVVDAERQPVAAALVQVLSATSPSVVVEATTRADGSFDAGWFSGADGLVHVFAPGIAYEPTRVTDLADGVEFTAHRIGALFVRVLDEEERAIDECDVTVLDWCRKCEALVPEFPSPTWHCGPALPPGAPLRVPHDRFGTKALLIEAEGHAPLVTMHFQLGPDSIDQEIVTRFVPGGTIQARVRGADGMPLAGATVSVIRRWPRCTCTESSRPAVATAEPREVRVTTDRNGVLEVLALDEASYRVVIEHADHADLVLEDVFVGGRSTKVLGKVVMERGAQIVGRVTFDGEALPFASVALITSSPHEPRLIREVLASADESGDFVLPLRVKPGRYWLNAAPPGPSRLLWEDALRTSAREIVVAAGEGTVRADLSGTMKPR
ncbi:MAG: carboxypeptidase regulatory-like domain-containing protein [Planctomycetes bacterium]|nr:carboxypeptidase regulatory-like domain-containing protein [Planctomycetota bacterium]